MKYLKGTVDYRLVFYQGDIANDKITIEAYCDADWAGNLDDRKFISGYVIKLGDTAISWKCNKQSCLALSTVEAEYVSASTASKEIIWLRRLLKELDHKQENTTVMHIDNEDVKELAANHMISQRTKYINIRYHFIRECLKAKEIKLKSYSSQQSTADIFMKGLPYHKFQKFRKELGIKKIIK